VVQTTEPEHFAIVLGARGDYATFAARLLTQREERGYPPFARLCRFLFEGADEKETGEAAKRFTTELSAAFDGAGLEVLGPSPAPLALLRGEHRFHTQLTARPDDPRFQAAIDWAVARPRETKVALKVDVDPASML
jgi:primosomal protein N' (replication factor Y)